MDITSYKLLIGTILSGSRVDRAFAAAAIIESIDFFSDDKKKPVKLARRNLMMKISDAKRLHELEDAIKVAAK